MMGQQTLVGKFQNLVLRVLLLSIIKKSTYIILSFAILRVVKETSLPLKIWLILWVMSLLSVLVCTRPITVASTVYDYHALYILCIVIVTINLTDYGRHCCPVHELKTRGERLRSPMWELSLLAAPQLRGAHKRTGGLPNVEVWVEYFVTLSLPIGFIVDNEFGISSHSLPPTGILVGDELKWCCSWSCEPKHQLLRRGSSTATLPARFQSRIVWTPRLSTRHDFRAGVEHQ